MTDTPPPSGFSQQLQDLDAVKLFVRSLPGWSRQHGRPVQMVFTVRPDGVECNVGMSAANPQELDRLCSSLIDRLRKAERLTQLTMLVDELRNAGVGTDLIDPMVEESERLARELHPPGSEGASAIG